MKAQIVAAAFHAGCCERDAERVTQHRQIFEEDLFLQVLRAGRHQHAFAAEDGRNEVGERLAGSGAGLGEQHTSTREDRRHRFGHLQLAGARLEAIERSCQRAVGGKRLDGRVGQFCDSGYSGNFRHSTSIFSRTVAAT